VFLTSSVLPAKLTLGVSDQDQIHRCSDSPEQYKISDSKRSVPSPLSAKLALADLYRNTGLEPAVRASLSRRLMINPQSGPFSSLLADLNPEAEKEWHDDWHDVLASAITLEKGQNLTSDDGMWRVGRRVDDGHLYISVRGREPVSTPLGDDDVVRVDTSRGLVLVRTRQSRHPWYQLSGPQHSRDYADDDLILALNVSSLVSGSYGAAAHSIAFTVVGFVDASSEEFGDSADVSGPLARGRLGKD
jgi:hypothetical protein